MAVPAPLRRLRRPAPDQQVGPSDDELLRLVAEGSEAAFEELWRRYGAGVHRDCRRILGDAGSAEDATQETFVRIWRGAAGFDPSRGRAAGWIHRIARNTSLNLARIASPIPREDVDPGAHYDADAVDQLWVEASLARLPAHERQALELAYVADLSHGQIAERLGEPHGTVKARIRRGLSRLADLAAEES